MWSLVYQDRRWVSREAIDTFLEPPCPILKHAVFNRLWSDEVLQWHIHRSNVMFVQSSVREFVSSSSVDRIFRFWSSLFDSHSLSMTAALCGRLDILSRCTFSDLEVDKDQPSIMLLATKSGNLDCVVYLHEKKFAWFPKMAVWAARLGHLDILRWLADQGCTMKNKLINLAAREGQWETVDWLESQGMELEIPAAIQRAADEDAWYRVLAYADEKGGAPHPTIAHGVAIRGDLPMMQELKRRGVVIDDKTVQLAVSHGHLEVLQEIFEHRDWNNNVLMGLAVTQGDLKIVEWLFDRNIQLTSDTMLLAYGQRRWDIVDWLKEKKCPEPDRLEMQFGPRPLKRRKLT